MENLQKIIIFLLFIFVVTSCEKEDPFVDNIDDVEVKTIIPVGNEKYLTEDSDYIFDQEQLHTYHLIIPQSSFNLINRDPAAERYVEGMLVFENDTLSPVGIRYKGSIGAFVNCVSGTDWSNPSGHKTCSKLSMKVKINWEDSPYKFYGLNKLQFHSQNLDNSRMRERLGYWLFNQMGVKGPRSVHARLFINGQYNGLFALTEQIDGRFAKYRFENGEGNVYKEVWPLTSNGNPQSVNNYMYALKTNEDENPSVDIINDFGKGIAAADEESVKDLITEWMDLDKIISYIVVDRTIRHDDGPFHFYCRNSNCNNHNYYWYEDPVERKLHLVPWDLDNAFENIISNANPVTPIKDKWGETSSNCGIFPYGSFAFMQRSASCDKLVYAWTLFEDEYLMKKEEFINGPLSTFIIEEKLQEWSEQIRLEVEKESTSLPDAISIAQWENALNQLKMQLAFARSH